MKDNFLGKKMRNLRSINKVNEDNASGYHTNTVYTGADRAVTGGNNAPLPVTGQQVKNSIKKAKDTLMGKSSPSSNGASVDNHSITNIDNRVYIDNSVRHSSLGDGLAWFDSHWKEIAIVAGAAALILAISKLIKGLNKSIKIRYNRVVKTLQRAQRDFTLSETGLNMKSVLPGVGSRIYDWIARTWTGNWGSKSYKDGNIGLRPFCAQYVDEIERDFMTAQAAYSKIKLGADESKVDDNRNTERIAGGGNQNVNTSAYSGKVYSSFREAYTEDFLNEGVSPEKVNESVLAMISAGVALTSFAVRAGQFLYQRYKKGKPVGKPKMVQVTKESTREICYAIINNYADKYVNMEQVFRELGISSKSLADIDVSACDKLAEILKKYQKPEKNSYTKQYSRLNEAYNKMLQHYYAIGDGIISNFIKYSEAKDEKHSNLIVASKEKLENMWDSQKDFYNNNFSHVLIEIVSSEPYINYLDFIIEKVIPVFKSGLASDADYVLDVLPKKGEYYLLRQTGNGQAVLDNIEVENGNVAIAEILGYDQSAKKMKFRLVGLVKGKSGGNWEIGGDGRAVLSTNDIDYSAYKENGELDESYGKWLSLDPVLLDWTPELYTDVYGRRFENGDKKTDQYIYAYATRDEYDKGFNKFIFINTKIGTFEILSLQLIKIDNYLSADEIKNIMVNGTADDEHNISNFYNFNNGTWAEKLRTRVKNYGGDKPEIKDVKNTDDLINEINEIPEVEERDAEVKFSNVYMRTFDDGKNTNDQYVYAYGDKDDKDEFNKVALVINKKGTNEILSTGVYTLDNYFTADDLEKLLTSDAFDPKFTDTSKNFTESQLKTYIERYKGTNNEEKDVSTTDDLADIINKKQEQKKSVRFSTIYLRDGYNGSDQRVYAYGDKDDKDEFNNVVIVNKNPGTNDIVSINTYTLDSYQTSSELKNFFVKAGFKYTDKNYNDSKLKEQIEKYTGTNPSPVQVHTTDELLKMLNGKKNPLNYSNVYKREEHNGTDQYIYTYGKNVNKDEFNVIFAVKMKPGTDDIISIGIYAFDSHHSISELNGELKKAGFVDTAKNYNDSKLKDIVENYKGTSNSPVRVNKIDDVLNALDVEQKKIFYTNVYSKKGHDGALISIFASKENENDDKPNRIYAVKEDSSANTILFVDSYKLNSNITVSELNDALIKDGFKDTNKNYKDTNLKIRIDRRTKHVKEKKAESIDDILNHLNYIKPSSINSNIYKRTVGKTFDQYLFFYGNGKVENEFNVARVVTTNTGSKDILFIKSYRLNVQISESELEGFVEKFDPKFESTGIGYDGSELQKSVDANNALNFNVRVGGLGELVSSIEDIVKSIEYLKSAVGEFFTNVHYDAASKKFKIENKKTDKIRLNDIGKIVNSSSASLVEYDFSFKCYPGREPGNIVISVNGGPSNKTGYFKNITEDKFNENSLNSVLFNGFIKSSKRSSNSSNGNGGSNESIVVTYDYSSDASESYSTAVNIIRKFDKKMKNWYVLSEAIYDDGSNKVSKLDNQRFVNSLVERSECSAFAKSSKFSKFMPYETKQTYKLVSEFNYTPSVATPLYESVLLVKFDNMDRIIDKKYLGKHKIC